jgi:glycosyltransferase involved in cell wall biosynthesis
LKIPRNQEILPPELEKSNSLESREECKITIGLPTYNNSETIGETIHSLKSQTFHDWECFVTDDSTSEETIDAARSAIADDPRFTLIKNGVRLGAAGNWNKTLGLANAKYFKLLCADDILAPDALGIQWQTLEDHPESVLCTGRRNIINSHGKTLIKNRGLNSQTKSISNDVVIRKFLRTGSNFFGEPSFALYRTEELRKVGGFNHSWSYLIDVVSYLNILEHGNLSPVTENLGSFRISSTSWSATLATQQQKEAIKCLDFAFDLDYASANRLDLWSGKLSATLSSFIRRAIFKFLG